MVYVTEDDEAYPFNTSLDGAQGFFEAFQIEIHVGRADEIEDFRLAPEIMIHAPLGDSGGSGDIVHARIDITLRAEQIGSDFGDVPDFFALLGVGSIEADSLLLHALIPTGWYETY
jgi:hypothetical protein